MKAPMVASLSPDGLEVRLVLGKWSGAFPVDALDRWIAFYRRLRDRRGGRYAALYAGDVKVLEALRAELQGRGAA